MKKSLLVFGCLALLSQSLFAVQMSGDVKAKYHIHWDDACTHWMKTEANICFDHNMDQAWLTTTIKAYAVNTDKTGIALDKAIMGYQFFKNEVSHLNVEIGKNKLENMFDSKLQYDSHFMGAHVTYAYMLPNLGHLTVHGGPCVKDATDKRYGGILEATFLPFPSEIQYGLKYSMTYWKDIRWGGEALNFAISQMSLKYIVSDVTYYAALLMNHVNHDMGFYIGLTYGSLVNAKDYMLDLNFQVAEPCLVPAWDKQGVEKGFQAKAGYALSSNFSLQAKLGWDMKKDIQKMEVGGIYTW